MAAGHVSVWKSLAAAIGQLCVRSLMTRLALLLPLVLVTMLTGCAYPNQFRNVRADAPHAVLVGDGVTVMHINGQPFLALS